MPGQENTSIIESARQQIRSLDKAAWEAYRDQQQLRAADLYGRACDIAESIADVRAMVRCRSWHGTALIEAGKLRQAITVLTPVLQYDSASGDAADIYRALTRYLEIAQRLPVSLSAIEKVYLQTESFLRDSNHVEWRHRILHMLAYLYRERGMYEEALKAEQEAWALWRKDHPVYTEDAHFTNLVILCIYLRDVKQAYRYLAEWETRGNLMPKAREMMMYSRKSDLARLEGRVQDAVDWARRAMQVDEQIDAAEDIRSGAGTLVRAFLCSGEVERAHDIIGRCFALRHSEEGWIRYDTRLLWADYHLGRARYEAGIAPVDDEFGLELPLPKQIKNSMATLRELMRARRFCDAALKVGRWIDEQLQCNVRGQEISKRYTRIERIENHCKDQSNS